MGEELWDATGKKAKNEHPGTILDNRPIASEVGGGEKEREGAA